MNASIYANVKDLPPSLRAALESVGYRRPDVELQTSETASRHDCGSAGRRSFSIVVDLATGQSSHERGSWGGANMGNPDNAVDLDSAEYPIPKNVAVITGSEGYKGVLATITVRPDAIAPLLPARSELTDRERWILYCYHGLKSSGRRHEWSRVRKPPTEDELQSLVSRSLIKRNKAGASQITTEGKNALGRRIGQEIPYAE